jgi:uncharacterized protein YggE
MVAATLSLTLYPAQAEERPTGISVTGECLRKVTRDRAAITISSSIVAANAKDSSKKANEAHEKIKSEVRALNLTGLSIGTALYSVDQECPYIGKVAGRVCEGYRTTISTRFETPNVVDLEEIIGIASKHGAENVSRLEVFVSPEALKKERESCLEIATKDAHQRALKIAAGAEIQLGKLLSVTEGTNESIHPWMGRGAVAMSAQDAGMEKIGPTIDAEPVDLRVSVTAVYAIQ